MGSAGSTLLSSLSGREIGKELLEPALLNVISRNGILPVADTLSFDNIWSLCATKVDVYLAHDHCKGDANHQHIIQANKKLLEKHLKTYFHDEIENEDFNLRLKTRIDDASCVIIFVTTSYLKKISATEEDNCKAEYECVIANKSSDKILFVIIDKHVRDHSKWHEQFKKHSNIAPIDLSEEITDAKITELNNHIMTIIGGTLQSMYDRCMAMAIIGPPPPPSAEEVTTVAVSPVVVDKSEWHSHKTFGSDPHAICFYADSTKLIACKADIKIWSTEGKLLGTHSNGSTINCACLNYDNSLLVVGDDEHSIKFWNTQSWKVVRMIDGLFGPVISVQFSSDGTKVVSVSSNYSIDVWSVSDGVNITNCDFDVHFPEAVVGALYTPDNSKIAVLIRNSCVKIVDAISGNVLCGISVKLKGDKCVAFTPEGHLIAADGKTISVRDINNGNVLLSYLIPQIGGFDILLCSIGSKVAFSFGSEIMIWDSATGNLNQTISVTHNVNGTLCFSSEGSYLAWSWANGKINLLK